MIKGYLASLCYPNTRIGRMGYGFIVYKNGEKLLEQSSIHPVNPKDISSNQKADWWGLFNILRKLEAYKEYPVTIYSSNQVMVKQASGIYNINEGLYKKYALYSLNRAKSFPNITYEFIRKSINKEVHDLVYDTFKKSGIYIPF